MKKLFAILIATSVLTAPFSAAQAHDPRPPVRHHHVDKKVVTKHERREIIRHHRWKKGQKLSRAERRHVVHPRDYRRYRLHAPRYGQQWVRVNDQVLLISAATGLILGMAAAY